jgi:hypothetical protein
MFVNNPNLKPFKSEKCSILKYSNSKMFKIKNIKNKKCSKSKNVQI